MEDSVMNHRVLAAWLCLTLASVLPGDAQEATQDTPAKLPVVPVSKPVQRTITDYQDFLGRTSAVQMVEVKARVSGYLVKTPFREGSLVKKGDILFEIDSRPYRAELDAGMAQVLVAKASLEAARIALERDQAIAKSAKGTVSDRQIDQERSAVLEATARVQGSQANLDLLKLKLDFCTVTSPIDGQVGRYLLTVGNLVNQDKTVLTTVMSQDPMFVYFEVDERTFLTLTKEKQIRPQDDGKLVLFLGLQGEEGFPHKGTLDFVNNRVDPNTGTISLRGVFANPALKGGGRLLVPGMVARIRVPLGPPHSALLIVERAILTDQGLKYVYVLDAQNKVASRQVKLGAIQPGGLRAIQEGLKPEDTVIVGALQLVRVGMTVQPELQAIPVPAQTPERPQGPPRSP
jgi:multidrug efflux system membrane fusion protein